MVLFICINIRVCILNVTIDFCLWTLLFRYEFCLLAFSLLMFVSLISYLMFLTPELGFVFTVSLLCYPLIKYSIVCNLWLSSFNFSNSLSFDKIIEQLVSLV